MAGTSSHRSGDRGSRGLTRHPSTTSSLGLAVVTIKRSQIIVLVAAALAILLVLYAWRLFPFDGSEESTENAYVRGLVTVIAPKVDGYVTEVAVRDFQQLEPGQALVRLDDRNYRQKLAQAEAALSVQEANLANLEQTKRAREAAVANAEAQIESARANQVNAAAQWARAEADQRRVDALVTDGSVSQREFDQTQGALRQTEAAVRVAAAQLLQARASTRVAAEELRAVEVNRRAVVAAVAGARAAVGLARIDLDNTVIRAPRAGVSGEVGVKLGQYVTPGTQLLALVPPQVWVVANFKEAQTSRMRVGQAATLKVDGLGGARLTGRVESLAPATGSEFSVIKADNATGNFTKIPQRLPVRIRVDEGQALASRLRPGLSVLVEVSTAGVER